MHLTLDHIRAVLRPLDRPDLSPYEKALYIHLVCAADDDGICRETARELGPACGFGKSKASDVKKDLREAGLIEIGDRKDGIRDAHKMPVFSIWDNVSIAPDADDEASALPVVEEDDPALQKKLEEARDDIFYSPHLTDEEKKAHWDQASLAIRLRHVWSKNRS